jgi:hypothetical protein
MPTGYCTVDDVRRALREADLPGDAQQDKDILIDAITAQTEWFEKTFKRHWYVSGGVQEDDEGLIPSDPKTRNDEHDIPTHGGFVHGSSEVERFRYSANSDELLESGPRHERRRRHHREAKRSIRLAFGDAAALEPPVDDSVPAYTRITFDRRDVEALNELHVVNANGGYDDWVDDSAYTGGVGNSHRGEDFWVRINNGGVSELYLDVHAMDDDIPSFSNAVYPALEYGRDDLPRTARRGIAFRAAADLTQEASIQIPDNARLRSADSLAEEFRDKADELLSVYEVEL